MVEPITRNWGGARSGGGRKPKVTGGSATFPVTIKLSEQQKLKLRLLGGATWVRDSIDSAADPTPDEG